NSGAITASARGGAVYILQNKLQIKNCILRNNTSLESGGAIYAEGDIKLKLVTFISNNSGSERTDCISGSGNLAEPSHPKITNSFFSNNSASVNGGGVHIINASGVSVTNSVFALNSTTGAGSAGAGIYADSKSYPGIINCTIFNNSSAGLG